MNIRTVNSISSCCSSMDHHAIVTDDDSVSSNTSCSYFDGALSIDCDTIDAMRKQEETIYKRFDPLHLGLKTNQALHIDIDEICRNKMCEWSYQIVDFCKFNRESVDIAMDYLDRFLLTSYGSSALQDRNIYQLVAMTCLYTAIKVHERHALSPSVVSQLSRSIYTEQQIVQTEVLILHALQWQLHPPTAYSFVRELMSIIPKEYLPSNESIIESIFNVAQKQTEYAISNYRLIETPMSTIAYCAVLNALECCCCINRRTISIIDTILVNAIGLTDPYSSYMSDIRKILSTVCPIQMNTAQTKDTIMLAEQSQLEYSSSSSIDGDSDTTSGHDRKSCAYTVNVSPRSTTIGVIVTNSN
jgi:hypothetical protein